MQYRRPYTRRRPSSTSSQTPAEPVRCSEKQQEFITRLLAERVVPDDKRTVIGDPSSLDKTAASKVIEYLQGLPKVTVATVVTDEGMYMVGSTIYKVQASRQGHLYAKVLQGGSFTYAPGVIKSLLPEHRMTVDQAKSYGLQFGRCCVCGRELTDPESVANGIGPVCAKSPLFSQIVNQSVAP